MNTKTRNASLFVALMAVVPLLYSLMGVKGGWAIAEYAPALWCCWLGVMTDKRRRTKWGIKAAVAVIVAAMIVAVRSFDLWLELRLLLGWYMVDGVWMLALSWRCLVWFIVGWCLGPAVGKSSDGNRRVFVENALVFISFALLYAWLSWSSHYINYSFYTYKATALSRLVHLDYYLSYIPLFGAVWYCTRIALSDTTVRLLNVRWLRVAICVVIILVGLWSLLLGFGLTRDFNPRLWLLLTNPLTAGLIYAIIRGINRIKCSIKDKSLRQ